MEVCIDALRGQLKQVIGTQTRLEHQMDNLYYTFCEADQKDFMRAFIERIDIYPEKPSTVEKVCRLSKRNVDCSK